jgi:hypothetical protein
MTQEKKIEEHKPKYSLQEKERKKKFLKNFQWKKSQFYELAKEKGWMGSRQNEIMILNVWRNISTILSNEFSIELPRASMRYKLVLFKWINDHFELFKETLNSLEFLEENS